MPEFRYAGGRILESIQYMSEELVEFQNDYAGRTWEEYQSSFSAFPSSGQAAGSHEIWYNKSTGRYTTIPNHTGDMPQATLRAILKQAGISAEDFIKKSNQ